MLAACVALAFAQRSSEHAEARPKPSDYPSQVKMDRLALGAEFMLRSITSSAGSFLTEDYLVIDVALYPAKGAPLAVAQSHFRLRLNGRKETLAPTPPGFVAAAFKYSDWERRPGVVATAGPVIIGRPRSTERFPGDPRPGQERLPSPPRAPDTSGVEKAERVSPAELAVDEALPEAEFDRPVRGFLYFHYKGKTKSLKKVELLYDGPAGATALALQ
jgi:hypothetical protein